MAEEIEDVIYITQSEYDKLKQDSEELAKLKGEEEEEDS